MRLIQLFYCWDDLFRKQSGQDQDSRQDHTQQSALVPVVRKIGTGKMDKSQYTRPQEPQIQLFTLELFHVKQLYRIFLLFCRDKKLLTAHIRS